MFILEVCVYDTSNPLVNIPNVLEKNVFVNISITEFYIQLLDQPC